VRSAEWTGTLRRVHSQRNVVCGELCGGHTTEADNIKTRLLEVTEPGDNVISSLRKLMTGVLCDDNAGSQRRQEDRTQGIVFGSVEKKR